VATGAIDTFEFIYAAIAVVVALPTLGTDGPSLTTAFAMTIFVKIEATQWVWYIQ